MPLASDLSMDAAKFAVTSVSEQTKRVNEHLATVTVKGIQWYEVGAAEYRRMRESGETPYPAPIYLPGAKDETIPSRDKDRNISVRVYRPDDGQQSKGVIMHIHLGFVLGSHKHFDKQLKDYANGCSLTAVSIGYRLAPEHICPAAIHDCYDAAEYLVDHAEKRFGAGLIFVIGESAGGHLAAMTAFHLLRARPMHQLEGVIMLYGVFDLSLSMPRASTWAKPLVVTGVAMQHFHNAFCPGMSTEERRSPTVSPLYVDMQELAATSVRKVLPQALFVCGTEDPLIDETLLMSMKWMVAPGLSVLKIYPGAVHGFTLLPKLRVAEEANEAILTFLKDRLAGTM